MTGQDDPLIIFELSPSLMAEMREAWQPYVEAFLRKQAAGKSRAIKQTPGPNPISSPCKENENENNNKRESSSYNSPLISVAPQGPTHSGERRHLEVRRLPASLHSLSSTPPLSPPPSPSCLLSFAHLSPSRVQMNATIEKLHKTVQRVQDVLKADIQSGTNTTLAAYQVESEKNAAENDKHAAEREKAEKHRAAAEVERAAASAARLENIQRKKAEREANEQAQIAEMKAKAAEMEAGIAARKLKEEEEEEKEEKQKAQIEEERSTLIHTRYTRCTRCTLYLRTSTILTLQLPAGTKPRIFHPRADHQQGRPEPAHARQVAAHRAGQLQEAGGDSGGGQERASLHQAAGDHGKGAEELPQDRRRDRGRGGRGGRVQGQRRALEGLPHARCVQVAGASRRRGHDPPPLGHPPAPRLRAQARRAAAALHAVPARHQIGCFSSSSRDRCHPRRHVRRGDDGARCAMVSRCDDAV